MYNVVFDADEDVAEQHFLICRRYSLLLNQ